MISKLRNLGPKSEEMLVRAGIRSVDQLRAIGAVRAFVQVMQTEKNISLNLLWALEGALSDRPWQEVARQERLRLLTEVESLENGYANFGSPLNEDSK